MSLTPGDLIQDKYRILRLIGQGGMGAVYEGENLVIARRVAIKVLHGMLAGDAAVIERFEREAQAAGRIGNDHIIEVLDMGRLENNDRFMVMEYLDGETLDQRCDRLGPFSEADLYPIVRQLLTGLIAAHAAGIVHRDLKPDNIFILQHKAGNRDFVKIIDFGISKFTAGGANFKMTMTGAIMGTPYYMAPEQAKGGKNVDIRSDVYAVGVVMFRALTGQVPFQADTFNELIFKIALSDTPHVQQLVPGIDIGLNAIVQRAMARNIEDRYQNALQFRDALDLWAEGHGLAVPGRGSQITIERHVPPPLPVRELATGTLPTAPAPANTHVPWSNSGVSQPGGKGKLWAVLGLAAVGALAVYILGGEKTPPPESGLSLASSVGQVGAIVAPSSISSPAIEAVSAIPVSVVPNSAAPVSAAAVSVGPTTWSQGLAPTSLAEAASSVSEPSAKSEAAAAAAGHSAASVAASRPKPTKPAKPVVVRPSVEPKPVAKPTAKQKPKDVFGY